ncbi:MAG: hypothetical protein Q9171_001785 [Xanthocarpia ochracea]
MDITQRDLKPENVLMNTTLPGARVILTDFGAASDGFKAATTDTCWKLRDVENALAEAGGSGPTFKRKQRSSTLRQDGHKRLKTASTAAPPPAVPSPDHQNRAAAELVRRSGPSLPFIADWEDSLKESWLSAKRRYSSLLPIDLARVSGPPLSFVMDMEDSIEDNFPAGQRDDRANGNQGIAIEQDHDPTEDDSINSPGDAASHMSLQSISLSEQ